MNISVSPKLKTSLVRGTVISPGLAQGYIHIQRSLLGLIDLPESITRDTVEEEYARLETATASISDDLIKLAEKVEKEIDNHFAEVFEAHQLIVNDRLLKSELRKEIAENLISAGSAVKRVFLRWEKRFLSMESQIAKDKSDDMRDISIRMSNALSGIAIHPLENIPPQCVLAVSRLLPSDTVFLGNQKAVAILMQFGSLGSHAALFAREMGLPCLSGIHDIEHLLVNNTFAQVDADRGFVIINPRVKERLSFKKKQHAKQQCLENLFAHSAHPAITRDGVKISVMANVSNAHDTSKAVMNGADGIGLYRMEHIYFGRATPPSTNELIEEMRLTLTAARDLSICIRLLDVGADKPLPFLGLHAETNPALGQRGIRLLRTYPQLLDTQLLALLKLSNEFNLSILIPMVTFEDDVVFVKSRLQALSKEYDFFQPPRLGAMIETPAAVLIAARLGEHVDFFSFGTNDLTQYTFAADRENATADQFNQNTADVIFRLLTLVHNDVPTMPLSACGELAGRKEAIVSLIRCGIRTLSIAAPLIPIVKETIRQISLQDMSKTKYDLSYLN